MTEVKIDVDYLLQIAGEDIESIIDIINDFKWSSLNDLNSLKNAIIPEVQMDTIGKILHKLRGASSSLGMVSLSKIFINLEMWDQRKWQRKGLDFPTITEHLNESVRFCKNALAK